MNRLREKDPEQWWIVFRQRRYEFETAWSELSEMGSCDGAYGVEFHRLLSEWIKGSNFKDVREFIRHEANKPPQTGGE